VGYEDVAELLAERDPQLARDLFQALGEALTLYARTRAEPGGLADPPDVEARLERLRAFRSALADRFPDAT
jgi:hypothetical protein